MSTTIKPWKELEKQFYRVNVGESSEEILNNPNINPSYINYTTDNNIIFNGVNYSAYAYADVDDYFVSFVQNFIHQLSANEIFNMFTPGTIGINQLVFFALAANNVLKSNSIEVSRDELVKICFNCENFDDYLFKYHNAAVINSYVLSYFGDFDYYDELKKGLLANNINISYNYGNIIKNTIGIIYPVIDIHYEPICLYKNFNIDLDTTLQLFGISQGNCNGNLNMYKYIFQYNYNTVLSNHTGLKYLTYYDDDDDYFSEYLSLTDENLNLLSYVKEYHTSYTPVKQSNVSLQSLNIYLESTVQPSTLPDAISDIQKLKSIIKELISSLKKSGIVTVS